MTGENEKLTKVAIVRKKNDRPRERIIRKKIRSIRTSVNNFDFFDAVNFF